MIPALNPYPAYKESGEPSLGEVPEHWEVRRLRNVAELRVSTIDKHVREDELPVRLCNYVDVYKNDRIRPGMSFMSATARAEDISRFRLEDGDVLITKDSEAWTDIGVPALVEGRADDLVSGYHLALLRPRGQDSVGDFLFRAIQSLPVAYQLHIEATGVTRYGLSHEAIKSVVLPLPPIAEQAAIVHFLDYMDRRIRRYIRARQKLIKLLEEEKQAIIHRAVTGQVDVRTGQPYPAYKPSGVEWLGDVPEGWEVRPAKYFYREVDERSASGEEELLSVSHITGVTRRSEKSITMFMAESYVGQKVCRPDDLVINTMWAWMGALGVSALPGIVSSSYGVYRPIARSPLSPRFADLLLRLPPYVDEYACRSTGITSSRLRLYPDKFLGIPMVCPSPPEQDQILRYVAVETAEAQRAVESVRRQISLLQEYRARLIADVVTGKLDVREAAALLPDEPDEADTLEDEEPLEESVELDEDAEAGDAEA